MTVQTPVPARPTDGPIHSWFSLSYSNYQVLHRTLMQSMPIEWQTRMVACLEELAAAYEHIEQPECFEVQAATEHIVNEMGEEQLKQAGIEADWYGGETFPGDVATGAEFAEWQAQHETAAPAYYRDGDELDGHQRVFLPAADPIPHYRHAYIEPKPQDDERTLTRDNTDAVAAWAGGLRAGGANELVAIHQDGETQYARPGDMIRRDAAGALTIHRPTA